MSKDMQPTEREKYLANRLNSSQSDLSNVLKSEKVIKGRKRTAFTPNLSAALSRPRNYKQDGSMSNMETKQLAEAGKQASYSNKRSNSKPLTVQSRSVFECGPVGPNMSSSDRKYNGKGTSGGLAVYESSSTNWNPTVDDTNIDNDEEESYENELAPVNLPFLPHQIKYKIYDKPTKNSRSTSVPLLDEAYDNRILDIISEIKHKLENSVEKQLHEDQKNKFILLQLPDGFPLPEHNQPNSDSNTRKQPIGKVKIYKSGKSVLLLNQCPSVPLELNPGIYCPLLQKVVSIDPQCHDMNCLGDIRYKFVISPNLEQSEIQSTEENQKQ
ncbi:hypothetical protein GJ496_010973 [Pomphorhynchus laevis]|nr:hypothetical protein GJ496_010973 [Pomphorhynchus laevis]